MRQIYLGQELDYLVVEDDTYLAMATIDNFLRRQGLPMQTPEQLQENAAEFERLRATV